MGVGGLLADSIFSPAQTLTWIGSRNDGSRACHAALWGLTRLHVACDMASVQAPTGPLLMLPSHPHHA